LAIIWNYITMHGHINVKKYSITLCILLWLGAALKYNLFVGLITKILDIMLTQIEVLTYRLN